MNLLNLNDEKFKNVTVNGFKFKIRYISPLDRIQITNNRVKLQGGNSVESLTQDEFVFFENIAIVNQCTDELPKDFNDNESCITWNGGDIDLINELAGEIRTHTADILAKLKKNRPVMGGGEG